MIRRTFRAYALQLAILLSCINISQGDPPAVHLYLEVGRKARRPCFLASLSRTLYVNERICPVTGDPLHSYDQRVWLDVRCEPGFHVFQHAGAFWLVEHLVI
jgi:hypothetical protein